MIMMIISILLTPSYLYDNNVLMIIFIVLTPSYLNHNNVLIMIFIVIKTSRRIVSIKNYSQRKNHWLRYLYDIDIDNNIYCLCILYYVFLL